MVVSREPPLQLFISSALFNEQIGMCWLLTSVTRLGDFLLVFGNKLSHISSPNILGTFWATSDNVTLMQKVCGYFLGNFWGKLGNFLFHHLVTLDVRLFFSPAWCKSLVSSGATPVQRSSSESSLPRPCWRLSWIRHCSAWDQYYKAIYAVIELP